jgi:hypothetical protein
MHYYYYYYYYLTAIGLTPGGSSTHLHTNGAQNTEDGTHITIIKTKLGSKLGNNNNKSGLHKFSKNLGATSKFQVPKGYMYQVS